MLINRSRKFLAICLFFIFINLTFVYELDVRGLASEENVSIQRVILSNEGKRVLLEIARDTLESVVKNKVYPQVSLKGIANFENFGKKTGLFVTLKIGGELRGCIGNIFPDKTILEAVITNTVKSAIRDRRFSPVEGHEVGEIKIEISLLSNIKKITSYRYYDVKKHGIIIQLGKAMAVFLPQVAKEQKWGKNETLSHLCLKAGLPRDAWKRDGMSFYVFTADVFGEHDFPANR